MLPTIPANEITLRSLKQSFGLHIADSPDFFREWSQNVAGITALEKEMLDRVKINFLELMEDPPLLENTVKLVILAPLLDLAGFYRRPFRIETETSIAIEMEDEGVVIRGRIDILVIKEVIWLVAIELFISALKDVVRACDIQSESLAKFKEKESLFQIAIANQ